MSLMKCYNNKEIPHYLCNFYKPLSIQASRSVLDPELIYISSSVGARDITNVMYEIRTGYAHGPVQHLIFITYNFI